MSETTSDKNKRRRTGALWASGAFSAAILVLGVNGTLSSWTSAIIDNTNNTVASTHAVALLETGPGAVTCDTTSTTTNQVSNCSSINKYGGTGTPLNPDSISGGDSQAVTVNLKNTGTGQGDLVLAADTCGSTALGGSTTADPTDFPVCAKVTVTVACTSPATLDTTGTPVVLSSFTGGAVGTLAAGAATDCTFTLNLPSGTPAGYSSQVASQVLHWTLTAS
ncbi:MAG: hypothetical protein JWQ32_418 [Marmoricola sp.]|nr:hypothetical protein [Marmoricola sp.]